MDKTPNLGLPLLVQGHVAMQQSFVEAMNIIDDKLQDLEDRVAALEA